MSRVASVMASVVHLSCFEAVLWLLYSLLAHGQPDRKKKFLRSSVRSGALHIITQETFGVCGYHWKFSLVFFLFCFVVRNETADCD